MCIFTYDPPPHTHTHTGDHDSLFWWFFLRLYLPRTYRMSSTWRVLHISLFSHVRGSAVSTFTWFSHMVTVFTCSETCSFSTWFPPPRDSFLFTRDRIQYYSHVVFFLSLFCSFLHVMFSVRYFQPIFTGTCEYLLDYCVCVCVFFSQSALRRRPERYENRGKPVMSAADPVFHTFWWENRISDIIRTQNDLLLSDSDLNWSHFVVYCMSHVFYLSI